ncbi:ARM repeat like protein [Babesia gibsoni]|uniref:ARM repeat like protein n=1 Tax=Babesia gibsoni TaxID=33632 RepID=A0AAD8LPJ7_BABGI|nr:ARM repeat like protein [Babesia gibsoni]
MEASHEEEEVRSYEKPPDERFVYLAFDFFKNELLGDDNSAMEAITHIDVVTQELGPEECERLLVPFLAETQATMPMRTFNSILDAWYTLSKISNSESYIRGIFQGLEFFISQEDTDIRSKGINLILKIVNDLKCSDASYNVVDAVIVPLLKKLSTSEWFAEAISACILIPRTYADASEENQQQLRECYKQLWETNVLIVRKEVARNLHKLLSIMTIEHSVSMFWLVLKNMSVDNQEDVRAHCVESCLAFAKRCSTEQNMSFSYPVILAAAADSSWRVRKAVARGYYKIFEVFGEDEFCERLLEAHFCLLADSNDIVQESALTSFKTWCKLLSEATAERYVTFFQTQLPASSSQTKQYICQIISSFAACDHKEPVKSLINSMVMSMISDDSLDLRLCVISNIEVLCERRAFEGELGKKITETIELILQGTRWHHRLVLAEKTTALYQHFGFGIFERYFNDMLFRLLVDGVWKVRNTMLFSIENICLECKATWATDTILTELLKMYIEPHNSKYISQDRTHISYSTKIILLQALVAVMKSLDIDVALAQVVPLLITATKDPVANVRFVAVKALSNLFHIYKDEDPESFRCIRSALFKLKQDSDIDVRYYATMALETYMAFFDT